MIREAEKIHKIVQRANAAGRAAGKPGVSCATVDKATREVIEESGYGQFFTHRTGHGIGMECHEEPYMRGDNGQLLETGMAYTVEPGIYLTGRNGVRIEDDVLVTADGSESMSTMSQGNQGSWLGGYLKHLFSDSLLILTLVLGLILQVSLD